MRVAIDIAGALIPDSGVGRYTRELIAALRNVASSDVDLVLFCNTLGRCQRSKLATLPKEVVNPRVPSRLLLAAWQRIGWPPIETFVGAVDVLHTSDWVHPPQRRGARVTTVHDLGAVVCPEWYAPDVVEIHRRQNQATADRADAIIAVSAFSMREFVRLYNVPAGRIRVVYEGVSPEFSPRAAERKTATARRFGLHQPFVLYVGTREKRKNVLGLIEIFARVRERRQETMLAIVGMRPSVEGRRVHGVESWTGEEMEHRVKELGLSGAVRVLGHVSTDELIDLYSAARVLVHPSLYEGFGLPVLEAMACGLPVVVSRRGALPEVVGDAGFVAEPSDEAGFADAVVHLLEDCDVHGQYSLRVRERAADFTWERAARQTLEVYEEVVWRRGGS